MKQALAALALGTFGATMPVASFAQQDSAAASSQPWQFSGSIYGYLPSIGGSTKFPVDTGGGSVNVTGKDIINALKFTVMGSLEANNGTWGIFTDLVYVNVGGSKSNTRDFTIGDIGLPVGTSANLDWNMKSEVWTTAATYRLVTDPAWKVDLLAGTRLFATRERLDYSLSGNIGPIAPPARTGSKTASDNVWSAIVGVKGRYQFEPTQKWALPFYLDVGGGHKANTVQAATGVSYAFGWGELTALWRYVDYHSNSDGPIKGISLSGPQVGGVFRW